MSRSVLAQNPKHEHDKTLTIAGDRPIINQSHLAGEVSGEPRSNGRVVLNRDSSCFVLWAAPQARMSGGNTKGIQVFRIDEWSCKADSKANGHSAVIEHIVPANNIYVSVTCTGGRSTLPTSYPSQSPRPRGIAHKNGNTFSQQLLTWFDHLTNHMLQPLARLHFFKKKIW